MGIMKMKALALVALLGLGIAGTAYGVGTVTTSADKVEVQEQVVYGDKAVTTGLRLDMKWRAMQHLSWTTRVELGTEAPVAVTDHQFHMDTNWHRTPWMYSGIYLFDRFTGWGLSVGDFSEFAGNGFRSEAFTAFLQEQLASRQGELKEIGFIRIHNLRAADYFEVYPLDVSFDMPMALYPEMKQNGERYRQVTRALRDFFRIPMLPNQYIDIEMGENPEELFEITTEWDNTMDQDMFYMETECVYTDRNIYLWFDNTTSKGNRVDTSLIPGGYGIYVLPYGPMSQQAGAKPDEVNYDLNEDGLRVFCPLQEEDRILHVSLSLAQDRLLVYVDEQGKLLCKVLDANTAEIMQVLDLGKLAKEEPYGKEQYVTMLDNNELLREQQFRELRTKGANAVTPATYEDDYTYLLFTESYHSERPAEDVEIIHDPQVIATALVARQPDGTYAVPIHVAATEVEQRVDFGPLSSMPYTLNYDGHRLAIAGLSYYYNDDVFDPDKGRPWNLAYLAVYTPEGLQYYGILENSLVKANNIFGYDSRGAIHWTNSDALMLYRK